MAARKSRRYRSVRPDRVCKQCKIGYMRVYKTIAPDTAKRHKAVRYFRCDRCGHRLEFSVTEDRVGIPNDGN